MGSHLAQPASVRANGRPDAGVEPVVDSVTLALVTEPLSEQRVDGVGEARREVMLDLVIQASDDPSEERSDDGQWRVDVTGGANALEPAVVTGNVLVVPRGRSCAKLLLHCLGP